MKRFAAPSLFAALALLAGGCANMGAVPEIRMPPASAMQEGDYRIEPGDTFDVKFFYSPDLNETVTVRPDGNISLQLIDDVRAAGLTPQELDDALTIAYTSKLPDKPDVSVIIKGFADQRIYVSGEVVAPGEYELKNKMTVLQAISAAGGFRNTAGRANVLVVRQDLGGRSHIYRANVSDAGLIDAEGGTYIHLEPRDIVFVPMSGVATADLFVDQYVRQLLLFNGFAIGGTAVYELNNKDENNNN